MKPNRLLLRLLMPVALALLSNCTTPSKTANKATTKPVGATDARDDYAVVDAHDPLEPLNRATFWLNDGIYNVVLRPISKSYEFITPAPVRQGINNVFDNAAFPVRFVNSALQGKFKRAGQEVQKFGVNTFAGFGGLIKQSDRIPSLTNVPREDTGQTLAKWGVRHGPYLVLPILGPSSARDVFGIGGDYALNPVNWLFALKGDADDFAWIPPSANTLRQLPDQLKKYDESRANALDPSLSIRSTYYQNRQSAADE